MTGATSAADRGKAAGSRWVVAAVIAVGALHAVQLFSPLRLNHDAVRLLAMAWSAHTTGSYAPGGMVEQFPVGYPAMVRALLSLGLGHTMWLNALNLAWLAVAAGSVYWIARRMLRLPADRSWLAALAPLLSWVTVKHVAIPLSDVPFLGLAMLALAFGQRFWLQQEFTDWPAGLAALLAAIASVSVRTVGLAVVGTVLLAAVLHPRCRRLIAAGSLDRRRMSQLVAPAGIIAVVGAVLLIRSEWFVLQFTAPSSYFHQLFVHRGLGPETTIAGTVGERLVETVAIAGNVPFPAGYPGIQWLLGGTVLAVVARSLWVGRRQQLPLLLFAALSLLILLVWPYADPRFLLPLIPVAALSLLTTVPAWVAANHRWRRLAQAYAAAYALLGVAALVYSIRLTVAGREMANDYSYGTYRLTYQHAFGLAPTATADAVDSNLLVTLRRFEPLAR
ncbi:MAG TPA: hypothetical protein VHD61_03980 [Lacunisphaera sp.]|nr:hypothetical protein [Lacunisphaera sp.]